MSCRVCEPTQLHHTITVVNLPLLMLIKIFEGNKEYNQSLIPDLNSATGDQGGIFKDQLIQRVTVRSKRCRRNGLFIRSGWTWVGRSITNHSQREVFTILMGHPVGLLLQQVHNFLFGGWKSKSLEWFNYKYPLLWYKLPKVCNITTGFSFLGYANHSVLQQFELNTGSIEVDR